MKKIALLSTLVAIIVCTVAAVLFIKFSNDHKECFNTTTTKADSKGFLQTTTNHICKERFAF